MITLGPEEFAIFGIGLLIGVLLNFIFGFINKKRRFRKFTNLRDEIDKGYAGLMDASKSFHNITDVLNDVEKRAK